MSGDWVRECEKHGRQKFTVTSPYLHAAIRTMDAFSEHDIIVLEAHTPEYQTKVHS